MIEDKDDIHFDRAMHRRLIRLVFWTRLVLTWERLWPRLWPFLITASLYLAAVLFDLFTLLPAILHLIVMGAGIAPLLFCLGLAFYNFPVVSKRDATLRLEKESGLENQPLQALLDHPAPTGLSKNGLAIWLVHQDRMAKSMGQIMRPWPKSELYKRDPNAVRAALILLLLLGGIEARFDYLQRFERAFLVPIGVNTEKNWQAQIWIKPPDYTGLQTRFISITPQSKDSTEPVSIMQFSEITLRLEGYDDGDVPEVSTGFLDLVMVPMSKGVFSLETTFEQGKRLGLEGGSNILFSLPVEMKSDGLPEISLSAKVQTGYRGHFQVGYEAKDDFGLQEVQLHLRKLDNGSVEGDIAPLKMPLNAQQARGIFRNNLADHPWAGEKVVATPIVIDTANQLVRGAAIEFILPERRFSHPLAMELVGIRKSLFYDSAEDRIYSAARLMQILSKPESFDHEIPVFLALNTAARRLHHYVREQEMPAVRALLWETAVHLDEGATGTQRNQLEDMAREMFDLMSQGGDRAAMEALFEQMRQSLQQYMMQAMESAKGMEGLEDLPVPENAEVMGQKQLQDMLDRAREMMRQGNHEAAMAMMQQFQSILSRLAMQPKTDPKKAAQAKEMMEALKGLKTDQENLQERTFRRVRNNDVPSLSATKEAVKETEEQNALYARLHDQMQKMRTQAMKIPQDLVEALQNMRQAGQYLEKGLDESAIEAQTRTLEALSKGLEESMRMMAQQMGMQPMQKQLPGVDPLGRGRGGPIQTPQGNIVPSEMEIRRSREILQELYRRAGQKGRAVRELEYIDRLLERF